jgi:hypothetical protein
MEKPSPKKAALAADHEPADLKEGPRPGDVLISFDLASCEDDHLDLSRSQR